MESGTTSKILLLVITIYNDTRYIIHIYAMLARSFHLRKLQNVPPGRWARVARISLLYRQLLHRSVRDEKLRTIRHVLDRGHPWKRRERCVCARVYVRVDDTCRMCKSEWRAFGYPEGSLSISVDCLVGSITRRALPIVIKGTCVNPHSRIYNLFIPTLSAGRWQARSDTNTRPANIYSLISGGLADVIDPISCYNYSLRYLETVSRHASYDIIYNGRLSVIVLETMRSHRLSPFRFIIQFNQLRIA